MKLDRRVILATAGAIVLFLAVWYFLLWNPRNNSIASEQSTLSAAQHQLATDRATAEALATSVQQNNAVSSAQAQSGLLEQAIPSNVDLAGIINDVASAAATSGIGLTNLTPAVPTSFSTSGSGGAIQVVHLAIAATGRYFQLVAFIDQLQRLPRVFVITSIGLTGGSSSGQGNSPSTLFTPNLTASIAASTYFSGSGPSSTSGGTPATTPGAPNSSSTATTVAPGAGGSPSSTVAPTTSSPGSASPFAPTSTSTSILISPSTTPPATR